ncbi:efflux RND transporter permease subunit [Sulfuriferula thiophila]|uniref:efflux RND transporter permease subunit n=1 Tax=Sulfuriferula thiophila TaxID=1781211 RepID=UPI000F607194|nr:MMPL family transporter [Sulfuriferula thiophila]
MNNFTRQYANWVVTHKWLVTLLTLAMIVAMALGAKRLTMSGDYRIFFKPDNPQLQAFEAMQKAYTKSDNILLTLAPADKNVFTRNNLAAVIELTDAAWQTPFSIRVDSISNYQNSVADGDTLHVDDLVKHPQTLTAADLARIRNIAVHDPLLAKRLIAENGQVTGINITLQMPGKNKVKEIQQAVKFANALKAKFETRHPDIKIYMTGVVMMNYAFLEATRNDMKHLVPYMMGILALLLVISLRSFQATGLIFLSIVLSIAAAMGVAGWTDVILSAPVATAPLTILIMAIADGVHMLSHYGHNVRHGVSRVEAMKESIQSNFAPMLFTNVTSALGYLTMNMSDVPPFQTLGNVVAFGIMVAFFITVGLVPALMLILPGGKVHSQEESKFKLMERYQNFFLNHRYKMLFGSLLFTAVVGSFVTQNKFDDSFHEYFDKTTEFRQATDFTLQHLTGVYLMDFSIEASKPGGINEPAFLQKTDEFSNWLRQQPEVLHVNTFTDIMKRLNKNMHADDPAQYKLPESRELAAQYLLLYELSLPYGLDLTNQINIDKSATKLTATLYAVHSTQMIALEERANAWLKAHGDGIIKSSGGTGAGLMFAHVGQENGKSMLEGEVIQILQISVLIMLAIRSFKLGIVSMVPNITPALLAYGVWGMAVGQINMGVAMVGIISLGIVVDDTMHFLSKYLTARREMGRTPEDALRYAFDMAGIPMWISTLTLVCGFLVLASSHFAMNSDTGLVTAITITFAALTEAFMLPGLILLVDRKKKI